MKRTLGVGPLHLSRRLLQLCGRGESHPVSPGAWFPTRGGKAPRGGQQPAASSVSPAPQPLPLFCSSPRFHLLWAGKRSSPVSRPGRGAAEGLRRPLGARLRIPSCFCCWGTSFASRSAAEMGDAATQVAPVRAGVLSSCHEGVVTWRSRETPCC